MLRRPAYSRPRPWGRAGISAIIGNGVGLVWWVVVFPAAHTLLNDIPSICRRRVFSGRK
jgi:hypothetical protein